MSDTPSKRGAAKATATAANTTTTQGGGEPPAKSTPTSASAVPPLFRRIDWYTFALTTLVTMIGYWWTLAPDLTLQDSGELAVGSFYAGVPHPPGYPVWTIYTWFFTVFFPVSNIAYRVAFSSAVAGALSCGLVALMVSRGSSMMIEGIDMLKKMDRRPENWLCLVSGFVAGMLIGFNGFMWSQAVIVEVYTLSVLSMSGVLVFLLRWIYAPQQRKYLYWAFFWFGISFNNHQSLLVIAIGLEVAILVASPRLGRELFFWNSICWLGGLIGRSMGLINMLSSPVPGQSNPLFVIYNLIGVASVLIWIYLAIKTKVQPIELGRDFAMVASFGYLIAVFGVITNFVTYFDYKGGRFFLFNVFGVACIGAFIYLTLRTRDFGKEWRGALACGLAWLAGAAFYIYMPLASMTNPPLNWGYPRTVQGFFHAFTRGQYERINPTTEVGRFFSQVIMYVDGALEEFNLVYLLIGLVPFLFVRFMKKRERAWMIGLTAIYLTLSVFLLILLNPAPDLQSRDLNRVFFTASHFMIAMGIGYGLTLITASLNTLYERYRMPVLIGFAVAVSIALYGVVKTYVDTYYWILQLASILGLVLAVAGTALLLIHRRQAPMKWLLIIFAIMPVHSILSHWSNVEQRGHLFGFWFGHDMFTPPFDGPDGKPIYPEMDRDTVLFGGTDPGRFNPTYMIFCEGFIPPGKRRDPDFDRRDVYLITQNALADGTYLDYIRAHYNRSTQNDPFFFSELFRGPKELQQNYETNIVARMMLPLDRFFTGLGDRIEKDRRTYTSWFDEEDITDVAVLAAQLKPSPDRDPLSQYLFERLSEDTVKLLDGSDEEDLREALAEDFNRLMENEYEERRKLEEDLYAIDKRIKASTEKKVAIDKRIQEYRDNKYQIYEPERFAHVDLTERTKHFLRQSPASHTLIRLDRILLEEAYPQSIAKSIGGVYPDMEIHTPSPTQSQQSFQEYLADAQKRLDHDRRFPNEPPQIKPGENVQIIDNRVQVSGQVAVMAINALLTKTIFDANPSHAFYVEESFPLDWMFPHLTPYGIIMKINRDPVPEFTQEIADKDHLFWSLYSDRLIGNWITHETTVSNVCEFVERVHIRRDYSDFEGDSKFIRDKDAQKAFSKLRSSIGGLYNYRISNSRTPAEQQRVIREAEFAFKQSYAYCPYSPEALFRFVQLLTTLGRVDEAILLARTSYKMDPYNSQIEMLIAQLSNIRRQQPNMPAQLPAPTAALPGQPPSVTANGQSPANTAQWVATLAAQPTHLPTLMSLVQSYMQNGQSREALEALDKATSNEQADANLLLYAVQRYNELGQIPRVESTLTKLLTLVPESPEMWFDLAAVRAILNNPTSAMEAFQKSMTLSDKRLAADPQSPNLRLQATNDPRLISLRDMPEFKAALQGGAAAAP